MASRQLGLANRAISGLTSAHRVVFDANGGADTLIGDIRPQDVVTGIPGISANLLSTNALSGGGIESDFDLMELMANNLTITQTLTDDATMRSGHEDAAMAMFGHASPFDHAIGLIDRLDMAGVSIHQIAADYALLPG